MLKMPYFKYLKAAYEHKLNGKTLCIPILRKNGCLS